MSQSPDEPNTEDAEPIDEVDAGVDDGVDDGPDARAAVAVPGPVPPDAPVTDYTDDGTPTFDYVRDRIEGRVATSIGFTELTGDTPEATAVDEQFAARAQAGRDRLEAIRRAMREE